MKEKVIRLYRCADCGRQSFPDRISNGTPCKCGSLRYRYTNPTFFARLHYCLHCFGLIKGLIEFSKFDVIPPIPEPPKAQAPEQAWKKYREEVAKYEERHGVIV